MTNRETFSWNIVTKNFHAHGQLRCKIRQKLAKLERHLQRFPQDAVHLQIALEKHSQRNLFHAALVLRLPSNILRGRKSASDPIPALDQTVNVLLRQLSGFKSRLRREPWWKRKTARAKLRAAKLSHFAATPLAEGTGPENESDVIRALLENHHARLRRYVRRHLWHEVALGKIPREAVDADAVVDEITREATAQPEKRPENLSCLTWFYVLARRELTHRCQAVQVELRETMDPQAPRAPHTETENAAGFKPAQRPGSHSHRTLGSSLVQLKKFIPDGRNGRATPPTVAIAQRELLERVQEVANTWPKPERETFELYFVEGLEPAEIGIVLGLPDSKARKLLARIHNRLRDTLLVQAAV